MKMKPFLPISLLSMLPLTRGLANTGGQATMLGAAGAYDSGLFTPLGDLAFLSETRYTTLSHPAFSGHHVRIKKSASFCDGTVKAYTGYLDVQAKHLFFYFFESRNDPDKDDVIMWTNGGPGASSAVGLFMEIGPCRIVDSNTTKFHPESWNSRANVFFIDQPVGVGFSYADYGQHVGTTEEAAEDIAAFVHIFFEHFAKFKGRPFHMAGESYGGRYLPVFASYLYDQNKRLVEQDLTPINLTSVMIGNGVIDVFSVYAHYYDTACTPVVISPVLDIKTCVRMKQALPRCLKLFKDNCIDTFDQFSCQTAATFCETEISDPLTKSGKNLYDITRDCEGDADSLCYREPLLIADYLNRPEVRKELGIDNTFKGNYSAISFLVNAEFASNMDLYHSSHLYVSALLERGVKVLIYVGINDWLCNHLGNQKWTLDLEWTHQKNFGSQPLRDWFVDGKKAGLTRAYGGFTYATLHGAGHLAPFDKPVESLQLLSRWLAGANF